MTHEDRDMLLSLRQQQTDLRQMLERLTAQLVSLEARTGAARAEVVLPPVPPEAFLPPIPQAAVPVALPPIPTSTAEALPPLPPIPAAAAQPSFESRFGRWLMRVGGAFLILALLFVASWVLQEPIGAAGKLGVVGLTAMVAVVLGQRFERRRRGGLFFLDRLLLIAGLAGLYFTIYAAHYDTALRVIPGPIAGGILLLLWSFYVLLLAERRKSQALGVFGLLFAYFSMALNSVAFFSMGADLVLTATAAAFLLRNGWTTLATFSALGTYFAMFHRLVFDSSGDLVLDTSRILPFLPPAVYLVFAWAIFTCAVILTLSPAFRGGKRFFFTSLNNGCLAFLLALSAYIAGYGVASIGWTLFDTGLVFLVVSRFAGFARVEPVALMGAYAAQGLALFTAGVIIIFTGITRALLLLLETLLLGIAGAFAGDRILTVSAYAAGFFATVFSIWQIAIYAHHPWLLGLGGAFIMLINAWSSRGEVRHSPAARGCTVASTSCYCLLALGLIFAAFSSELTDASLPVALAAGALVLTFAIYHFSIFELPPLAQILMVAALILVLFPVETGEELPWWTICWVGGATLILVTWWSRQRLTKPGAWIGPLSYYYALALVYLAVLAVRPFLDAQGWMVAASLLSVVFQVYGALLRVWPMAIVGQLLLALSLAHAFFPPQSEVYPWAWWAAAVPVLVTFATARAAHHWIQLFPETAPSPRAAANFLAYTYKLVALVGVMRVAFGVVPATEQMAAFLFLGTFLLAANVRRPDTFGARCGLLLSALGMYLCLGHAFLPSWLNGFSVLLLVAQVPLLASAGPLRVTALERWTLSLTAVLTAWLFVSVWAWPVAAGAHSHLSLAWAVFAFFLFVLGFCSGQGILRWCGLVVLGATMLRVVCVDLWSLPGGVRILTVFLLAIITLGIGLSLRWRNENPPV